MTVHNLAIYYRMLSVTDLVTCVLVGEAEGDGIVGMIAVANVLANRVRVRGWFGEDLRDVCLQQQQFRCLWEDLTARDSAMRAAITPPHALAAQKARLIAEELVAGTLPDITGGATHYLAPADVLHVPDWVRSMTPVAHYGRLQFYR